MQRPAAVPQETSGSSQGSSKAFSSTNHSKGGSMLSPRQSLPESGSDGKPETTSSQKPSSSSSSSSSSKRSAASSKSSTQQSSSALSSSQRRRRAIHDAAAEGSISRLSACVKDGENINEEDKNRATPFHYAAGAGHVDAMRWILEHGGEIDRRDRETCGSNYIHVSVDGLTPLAMAAANGYTEAVQWLLRHGANYKLKDKYEEVPLHKAAFEGHLGCVQALLHRSPDTSRKDADGATALHHASYNGHVLIVKELLRHQAEVNSRDFDGVTPLHKASYNGYVEVVKVLLKKGAEVNGQDRSKQTPLHFAVLNNHDETVTALLEYGADVDARDSSGQTALHVAALCGYSQIAELLLMHGAKVNARDAGGATPLHNSCFKDHDGVARVLCSYRADVNANLEREGEEDVDSDLSTPLHYAAYSGAIRCLKLLLNAGANVDARDSEGATPLHKAASKGRLECVQALLDANASINAQDDIGCTPLHFAASRGKDKVVALLLDRGANINAKDGGGETPLFCAVHRGHRAVAEMLMARGADIRVVDVRGNTLLHVAARYNQPALLEMLIAKGLALNAPNKKGMTPLHAAGRNAKCVEILLDKGANVHAKDNRHRSSIYFAKDESALRLMVAKGALAEEGGVNHNRALAVRKFNINPQSAIDWMAQEGVIRSKSPTEVAKFLWQEYSGLNRQKVGEYLGARENEAVLAEYVHHMDFTNRSLDQALREFLSRFRLPSEAQVIDRFMMSFANRYCQNNPNCFRYEDTAYVLAFSLIMLNTDAHNPNVRKKMTKEQFVKNNRAVHGEEISVDFLEKLYDSIISEEIKVDGSLNFFQNAEKTGWLTKQGGRIKSWKKRWFVLTGNCLLYFREPAVQGNEKPLGIIPLENLAVRVVSKEVSKHIFELYHPEHTSELMKAVKRDSEGALVQSNHERYLIRAPSLEEMKEWVQAIQNNILSTPMFELINRRKKARAGQRGSAGFSS